MGGIRRRLGNHPVVHRRNRRALAGDFSGHALEQLARRSPVHEDVEFGLAEEIDETRGDDEVGRIDGRGSRRGLQCPDRRNAIADHPDIAAKPGRTRTVDDAAVDQQDVEAPWLLCNGDNRQDSGRQKGHQERQAHDGEMLSDGVRITFM